MQNKRENKWVSIPRRSACCDTNDEMAEAGLISWRNHDRPFGNWNMYTTNMNCKTEVKSLAKARSYVMNEKFNNQNKKFETHWGKCKATKRVGVYFALVLIVVMTDDKADIGYRNSMWRLFSMICVIEVSCACEENAKPQSLMGCVAKDGSQKSERVDLILGNSKPLGPSLALFAYDTSADCVHQETALTCDVPIFCYEALFESNSLQLRLFVATPAPEAMSTNRKNRVSRCSQAFIPDWKDEMTTMLPVTQQIFWEMRLWWQQGVLNETMQTNTPLQNTVKVKLNITLKLIWIAVNVQPFWGNHGLLIAQK